MKLKLRLECAILILSASFFFISSLNAEDNKNYAACEICDGAIHYGPEESREILGRECFEFFAQLNDQLKTIKLDLDGVLKNGSREKPDKGYELIIKGASPFHIDDLRDGSSILISNKVEGLTKEPTFDNWKPEIFLYASESNGIDLKDPMDAAWEKMKMSAVYYWVISKDENMEWKVLLKARILEALKLMVGQ